MNNSLYEQDFVLWTKQQAKTIQNQALDAVDWVHIQEQILALGRSEKMDSSEIPSFLNRGSLNSVVIALLRPERLSPITNHQLRLMTTTNFCNLICYI